MKILGLQKLTLLDYPGKVACTVFLGGCNFRCPFCHNAQLLEADVPPLMGQEALLAYLRSRKGILDGVCITGGEPTLYSDLEELIRKIRELGFSVKLDTNGYRPQVLKALVEKQLVNYVAMDVKNGPEHYAQTVGLGNPELARIEESIRFLAEGNVDYELRTTVVHPLHDAASITAMGQWLLELGGGRRFRRLFIQPFADRDTVPVAGLQTPDSAALATYQTILQPCAERVEIRGA